MRTFNTLTLPRLLAWQAPNIAILASLSALPFTNRWEALPLLSLCRTIERDLREAIDLGPPSVPAAEPNAIVR